VQDRRTNSERGSVGKVLKFGAWTFLGCGCLLAQKNKEEVPASQANRKSGECCLQYDRGPTKGYEVIKQVKNQRGRHERKGFYKEKRLEKSKKAPSNWGVIEDHGMKGENGKRVSTRRTAGSSAIPLVYLTYLAGGRGGKVSSPSGPKGRLAALTYKRRNLGTVASGAKGVTWIFRSQMGINRGSGLVHPSR